VEIVFSPARVGNQQAVIKVKTSAPRLPEVEIRVTGTGVSLRDRAASDSVSQR
jgi:hypothetical protein